MGNGREKLAEVIEKLKTQRDELKLKAHLGSMEAKEEWAELEKKWRRLEEWADEAKEGAIETSKEIGENVEIVTDELRAAYRRIRERQDQD